MRNFITILTLLITMILPGLKEESHAALIDPLPSIELEIAMHFLTPDGSDVVVKPGRYEVEAAESWIRLIPGERRDALLLIAQSAMHTEPLDAAQADLQLGDDDTQTIVLLLPGGRSLEAIGSVSGVQSRAITRQRTARAPKTRQRISRHPSQTQKRPSSQKAKPSKRPTPSTHQGGSSSSTSNSEQRAQALAQRLQTKAKPSKRPTSSTHQGGSSSSTSNSEQRAQALAQRLQTKAKPSKRPTSSTHQGGSSSSTNNSGQSTQALAQRVQTLEQQVSSLLSVIQIIQGGAIIQAQNLSLQSTTLNIETDDGLNITSGANLDMNAALRLRARAGTDLQLKGDHNAKFEGGAATIVKGGAQIKVEGGARVDLKGPVVNLGSGSGLKPVAVIGSVVTSAGGFGVSAGTVTTGSATVFAK